jgi:hypothetical protein
VKAPLARVAIRPGACQRQSRRDKGSRDDEAATNGQGYGLAELRQAGARQIGAALEAAGVIFLDNGEGPGVKLRKERK